MSSPTPASAGGVLLVTQVYPPQLQGTPQQGAQTFIRAELIALGYITSGSHTVAAGKSPSRCLVKASFAFNVLVSVASVVAIICYSVVATGMHIMCYDDNSSDCYLFRSRMQGFAGVLAVFHALEFFVSITCTAFTCKGTCNYDNQQQQQVYVIPGNASLAAHAPSASYAPPAYMAHPPPQVVSSPKPEGQVNPGLAEPPPYTQLRTEQF